MTAGPGTPAAALSCGTCDGSGVLTVPDASGESASEQACPGSAHDDDPFGESRRDAIDAQTLHDSPGSDDNPRFEDSYFLERRYA